MSKDLPIRTTGKGDDEEIYLTMHAEGIVHEGGPARLLELVCESCGKIPEDGDTIHYYARAPVPADYAVMTYCYCGECYAEILKEDAEQ